MKKLLILLCLSPALVVHSQIITSIAGTSSVGHSGDGGLATGARLNQPYACAFDLYGNLYFTEVVGSRVRKISPSGIITTVGGTGTSGYNGDNILATTAQLNNPVGITTDSVGNIYIADSYNSRIRKIDVGSGIITTIAGNGSTGYAGDGTPATAAIVGGPVDICFDKKGNLFILDYTAYRIRKVNQAGIITTFAGNGINGNSGDGGMATAAQLHDILGICADDNGNIYFSQRASGIVRKINAAGIITTYAGSGSTITSGDGGPATSAGMVPYHIAIDKRGNLFMSGYNTYVVRKVDKYGIISNAAGKGTIGFSGDNGLASLAELHTPIGVAVDSCGNLYIADRDDYHIRKVAFNPACAPVGVNTVTEVHNLSVYPNPANHLLHIDNLQTNAGYRILSVVGAAIQQGVLRAGSNELNIRDLPPGMYLLEINEDGKKAIYKVAKQ